MHISFQIFAMFTNTITCALLLNYIVDKFNKKNKVTEEKLDILFNKLNKVCNELNEVHEVIDLLEDTFHKKQIDMLQSNDNIINQIDNLITSNYDITD